MTVTIKVAGQDPRQLEGELFAIGTDPDCALRLPANAGIAPRHAVLRRVAGRWLVEAAPEQLMRIGDGRPTRLAWLNPGDIIHLSASGPSLAFEPPREEGDAEPRKASAAPPTPIPAPSPAAPAPSATPAAAAIPTALPNPAVVADRQLLWFAAGGAGILAAGILLAVVVLRMTGSFDRQETEAATQSRQAPNQGNSPAETPAESTAPNEPVAAAASETKAKLPDPAAAVYLVTVGGGEKDQTYRLGTAWAVAPRKLVTSAAVAIGLRSLRDVAPQARAVASDGKRAFTIRSHRIHPQYEAAAAEGAKAQAEAEALRLELEQSPPPDRLKTLTEGIVAAEEKRFLAFERQVAVDVAVLEIDGDLPQPLPIAPSGERHLKPGNRLRLAGLPFPQDDFICDPDLPLPVVAIEGSVRSSHKGPAGSGTYWRLRSRSDLGADNWSGAPVIDARGRVVGVYSRPTPPPPGETPPPTWISHDFAEAGALAALGDEWK